VRDLVRGLEAFATATIKKIITAGAKIRTKMTDSSTCERARALRAGGFFIDEAGLTD
jgi:hypothetical protein